LTKQINIIGTSEEVTQYLGMEMPESYLQVFKLLGLRHTPGERRFMFFVEFLLTEIPFGNVYMDARTSDPPIDQLCGVGLY